MTKYFAMSGEDALRYLKARDNEENPILEEFQRMAGAGDLMSDSVIKLLSSELRKLKKKFPLKLRERDQEGGRFEQLACEIVHRSLAGCGPDVLADFDFWTWISVARLADITEWRFGVDGRYAKPENYGIGKRSENLFFRLWLRAELATDSKAKDPYHLAKTGDQDLWRSHILRQGYSNARLVTKALLRLQAGQLAAKRLGVEGVRELAKRLRRMRTNVFFEFLSAAQAEALVLELSADLKKGK